MNIVLGNDEENGVFGELKVIQCVWSLAWRWVWVEMVSNTSQSSIRMSPFFLLENLTFTWGAREYSKGFKEGMHHE